MWEEHREWPSVKLLTPPIWLIYVDLHLCGPQQSLTHTQPCPCFPAFCTFHLGLVQLLWYETSNVFSNHLSLAGNAHLRGFALCHLAVSHCRHPMSKAAIEIGAWLLWINLNGALLVSSPQTKRGRNGKMLNTNEIQLEGQIQTRPMWKYKNETVNIQQPCDPTALWISGPNGKYSSKAVWCQCKIGLSTWNNSQAVGGPCAYGASSFLRSMAKKTFKKTGLKWFP